MSEFPRPALCLWPHCRKPQPPGCLVCPQHTAPSANLAPVALHILLASYPNAVELGAVLRLSPPHTRRLVARLTRAGHTITRCVDGWIYVPPKLPAPQERLAKYRQAASTSL